MKQKITQRKLLLLACLIIFLWLPNDNFAQSVKRQCISSYGSVSSIDSVSICQTAGQSYNTIISSNGKTAVLQGFHQPITFFIEERKTNSLTELKLSIFPNPASFEVKIESEKEIKKSHILVVDANGKFIYTKLVSNLQHYSINCASWVNGVYFLTIQDAAKNSKSYKLVISK